MNSLFVILSDEVFSGFFFKFYFCYSYQMSSYSRLSRWKPVSVWINTSHHSMLYQNNIWYVQSTFGRFDSTRLDSVYVVVDWIHFWNIYTLIWYRVWCTRNQNKNKNINEFYIWPESQWIPSSFFLSQHQSYLNCVRIALVKIKRKKQKVNDVFHTKSI